MTKKRIVVTGSTGAEWRALASVTYPGQAAYAVRHGAVFMDTIPRHGSRPPSWGKLVSIASCLANYDEVLWLDADVVVHDATESIFEDFPSYQAQAACRLRCPSGKDHWNLGVWLLRRDMMPYLVEAAMRDDLVHHPWWEQAAMNEIADTTGPSFHPLNLSWNAWPGDCKGPVRFFHACGIKGTNEKVQALREWL